MPYTHGRRIADLIEDLTHTWDDHHGVVTLAARRLGMNPESLATTLWRARKRGITATFYDDTAVNRTRERRRRNRAQS